MAIYDKIRTSVVEIGIIGVDYLKSVYPEKIAFKFL